jgi:hypothetical protein
MATTLPQNNSIAWELFYQPLVENPPVQGLGMNFIEGKIGRELYFDSKYGSLGTPKTECGFNFRPGTGWAKKDLNPKELDFSVEECYIPFLKSVFGDNLPNGHQKGELYPELIDRMTTKQLYAANEDLLAVLFLGDTSSSNSMLATIDGVDAKWLAGVANGDGTVDAGAITATDLLPANIEATFNRVFEAQPRQLRRQAANLKKFWVTGSVYYAFQRYLQINTGTTTIVQTSNITEGITIAKYNGIEIVNLDWLDDAIVDYNSVGSPPSTVNPHRIYLTMPSNHALMMDGSGYTMIDPFYDRKDDKVYSPLTAMIDYQYGFGFYNVFAGF